MIYDPARRSELLHKFQAYEITVPEGEDLLWYLQQDLARVQGENRLSDAALLGGTITALSAYVSALRTTQAVDATMRRASGRS